MINYVRNFFTHRRNRQHRRDAMLDAQYNKYVSDGVEGFVTLIEPGAKKQFLQRNNVTYNELEHRYSVHIWVYAAINAIAEKSAMPPLVLKNEDGEMMDSPLPARPNSIATWDEVEQLVAIYLELTGNAYIHHDTNDDTFWVLRPSRVRIVPGEDGRSITGYAYNRSTSNSNVSYARQLRPGDKKSWMQDDPDILYWNKKEFKKRMKQYRGWVEKGTIQTEVVNKGDEDDWMPFETNEILHFKTVSPTHDFYGVPPIYPLLTNLSTELYARQWNKNFFENGAIPPGVLIIPKILPEKTFETIKEKFIKQYGGTKNRGKPLVLQGGEVGADYKAFPGQHRDLEFLNGLDHNRDETLAVLNVPPEILGISIGAQHSGSRSPGIRDKKQIFWKDTIQPKLKMRASRWTDHYKDILPDGYTFGHDFEDIDDLKPDYTERTKAASQGLKAGMTVEEVRENILGLSPEWKGYVFVPANMVPIRYGEAPQALPAPETPEAMPAPDADDETEPMPEPMKEAAD